MRLIRFGKPGAEKPGILTPEGVRLDASAFGEDFNERFFEKNGVQRLARWLKKHAATPKESGVLRTCPAVPPKARWGAPVARPSKIICIGLNYARHAAESGMEPPKEPVIFFKSTTALCGPNDDLVIPKNSEKTDWEVELAVVVGRRASHVGVGEAMGFVAGYALHNDYSERHFQLERGGQWVKGKSCDTFAPLGPWLATPEEIPDPHRLRLWLKVNGETMQDSTTADFIFDIPTIISYASQFMTLLPGDVISTGTPQGVGLGQKPPRYLRPGDAVTLGIEGLGEQRQRAVSWQG